MRLCVAAKQTVYILWIKKKQSWQIEVGLHYITIDETCGLPWTMNEANAANRLKRVPYVQNLNRNAVTFFPYDFGHLKKDQQIA